MIQVSMTPEDGIMVPLQVSLRKMEEFCQVSTIFTAVALPARMCQTVAETVASERDKWHSEMWNSQVYSVSLWAQRRRLQSLSPRSVFWVAFIQYRLPSLVFPEQAARPSPFPSRQCSCLRSWVNKMTKTKLISNAWSTASRAASKGIRHVVAARLQEGWHGTSKAAVRHAAASSAGGLFL